MRRNKYEIRYYWSRNDSKDFLSITPLLKDVELEAICGTPKR